MNILKILNQRPRSFYLFLLLLGFANSMFSSSILLFINHYLNQQPIPFIGQYNWLAFCVLLIISLVSSKFFQSAMARLTKETVFELEAAILDKLKKTSFEAFEKIDAEKVYTAVGDARALSGIPSVLLNAFNALIVVLFCLVYIGFTSLLGGGIVLGMMLAFATFYVKRGKAIERNLVGLRNLNDDYFRYLHDVLQGFKEVSMSSNRRHRLYENHLRANRAQARDLDTAVTIQQLNNELVGSYSWYVVLGITLFALPSLINLQIREVTSFTITVLYMIGSVSTLIGALSFFSVTKVSYQRLRQFEQELASDPVPQSDAQTSIRPSEAFQSLAFGQVSYRYPDFVFGPVDFQIRRGEILFIAGGNGSGKSTFVKILTGLYQPSEGTVLLNDQSLSDDPYRLRDSVSAIFTNNHLFQENYDAFDLSDTNPELTEWKELLNMTTVLRYLPKRQVFDTKLSKGQQKRLAMIYALMEKRDLLILDEWAAEQDPWFRSYFYETLLPDFRQRGKTLVVVSHDDRYYACADRILTFEYGRIAKEERIIKEKALL